MATIRAFAIVAACCAAGCISVTQPGRVYSDVDRFTGARHTTMTDLVVYAGIDSSLRMAAFRNDKAPGGMLVTFISHSGDWLYLKARHVRAVADGETFDLGEARHDGKVMNYGTVVGVREALDVAMDNYTFMKIANARSSAFSVGGTEFDLLPNHKDAMRKFTIGLQPTKVEDMAAEQVAKEQAPGTPPTSGDRQPITF